jgi:cytochrome c oxidase subunit II
MDFFKTFNVSLPDQASTYAASVDHSMSVIHYGMLIIFVLWSIFFIYCLMRFRRSAHPKADPTTHKWAIRSFLPDIAILVFELYLIFVFGLPIWAQIKDEFPKEKDSLTVRMVSEQFAWSFQYAGTDLIFGKTDPKLMGPTNPIGLDLTDEAAKDDIVTTNQLFVPVNKPVIVQMSSKDVIHSFFVPEFRVKQDVVPGMLIPLWFEASKTGTFGLVCSQLCGLGHYRMKGEVIVTSQEEFDVQLKTLAAEAQQQQQPS